jgi:hypothetical protein
MCAESGRTISSILSKTKARQQGFVVEQQFFAVWQNSFLAKPNFFTDQQHSFLVNQRFFVV